MPLAPDPRERFEAEYISLYRSAFAYALRRCGDQDTAHDAAAEALAVMWRRLDDAPQDGWLAWVLGICRRALANQRRAAQRQYAVAQEVAVVAVAGRDDTDAAVTAMHLRSAWNRLSEDDRDLLALVAWDGLDAEDAARVLGCSKPTFAVRLHRARRRLLAALDDTASEGLPPMSAMAAQEAS